MSKTFKILTYNVNFGSCPEFYGADLTENCKKVIQAIKEADAEIVCLQETNEGWEYLFNKHLSSLYPNQHFSHRINEYLASGSAILTKKTTEIIDVKMKKPNVEGTYFYQMICKLKYENSTDISLVNVHLVPPLSMTSSPCSFNSFFAYCFRSSQLHFLELSELISYLHSHHFSISKTIEKNKSLPSPNNNNNNDNNNNSNNNNNINNNSDNNTNNNINVKNGSSIKNVNIKNENNVFIVGDFNEGWGRSDHWLDDLGYADALKHSDDKTTWYWPLSFGFNLWGSYDHIYHKLNPSLFKFLECKTFTDYRDASDHLPVLATFQIL